nr:MAG TPA: hypothetical protein [Caudoviricetes sp.]
MNPRALRPLAVFIALIVPSISPTVAMIIRLPIS